MGGERPTAHAEPKRLGTSKSAISSKDLSEDAVMPLPATRNCVAQACLDRISAQLLVAIAHVRG